MSEQDRSTYLTQIYCKGFAAPARIGSSITFANGLAAIVVGFKNSDGTTQNYNNPVWESGSQDHVINTAQKLVNERKLRAREGEPTKASELLNMLNLNKQNQQAPLDGSLDANFPHEEFSIDLGDSQFFH